MIKGIAHVCIGAGDLAATRRFYCSGLGLEKVFDFIRSGEVFGFYLRVGENAYIEVFRQEEIRADERCPIRHLCLEVDDVEATIQHLREQGYEATDRKLGSDRSWQAWTSDPDGIRIEFHQYTPESSQKTGRDCVLS